MQGARNAIYSMRHAQRIQCTALGERSENLKFKTIL
jgi:hypothetical protein